MDWNFLICFFSVKIMDISSHLQLFSWENREPKWTGPTWICLLNYSWCADESSKTNCAEIKEPFGGYFETYVTYFFQQKTGEKSLLQ